MVEFYFKAIDANNNQVVSNTKSTSNTSYVSLGDFVINPTNWLTLTDDSLCTLELYCKGHYAVGQVMARQKETPKSDHVVADEKYDLEIEHEDAQFTKRKEWQFFKGLKSFEAAILAKEVA